VSDAMDAAGAAAAGQADHPAQIARLSPAKRALLERLLAESPAAPPAAAIPRRGQSGPPPLSFSQRRLWFLDRLGESGPAYNVVSGLRLRGPLKVAALAAALAGLIRRHEALRTCFPAVDGEPVQRIAPPPRSALPLVELAGTAAAALAPADDELDRLVLAEAWRGFDLERGPLLRLRLFRLGAGEHVLLLVMHHIISDGWSTGVFIRELTVLYRAAAGRGRQSTAELPRLPVQYADFTAWQRGRLTDAYQAELFAYWDATLRDVPRVLELPCDWPRPPALTFRGRWLPFELDAALTRDLDRLCQRAGVTPFMALLAAFGALLARLCAQPRLAIGCPVANRTHSELEPLIGFFVNTLVLRLDLGGDPTTAELLEQVRRTAVAAFRHQDLPFERLVELLRPERDLARNPVVQVVFAFQQSEAMAQDVELPGLAVAPLELRQLPVRFDLELHMWRRHDRLHGTLIYCTDLFRHATMEHWLEHFRTLLGAMAGQADQPVSRLPLLSERQRELRRGPWSGARTALPERSIHQLFAARAAAFPDATAIVAPQQVVAYGLLDRRANRVARGLLRRGAGPETVVALAFPRSPQMILAMLGTLKAGAAYLPLDPGLPPARARALLAGAGARLLVAGDGGELPDHGIPACRLGDCDAEDPSEPAVPCDPANAAYVNFTSGSTGAPKGIVVPHGAVVRLVCNTDYVAIGEGDAVAHAADVSFDASTFEIWGALIHGARIVVVPRDTLLSPREYAKLLREQAVDHVFLTTALFNRVVDDAPEGLSGVATVLFGGEMSDPARVARLLAGRPPRRLLHVYGPTECTTFATAGLVARVERCDGLLSIGRPIANTRAAIADPHFEPAAVGAPGELLLGGAGLARGYLGRADLTAASFVPDPWGGEPGARLYRSGDLARYRPDGEIDILGRLDRQVKIRGFRIEPGEIEARLLEHPAVREAAVVVRPDAQGDRCLLAYVSVRSDYRPGAGSTAAGKVLDAREQIARWEDIFERHVYTDAGAGSDPLFNTTGWVDSYEGEPFPDEVMRRWADDVVGQVVERRPRQVLEIGCGTGMLLFRIAPHCDHYRAIDFSPRSLAYVRARIAERQAAYGHVVVSQQRAHEMDDVAAASYDAVILNSVVQYFPDLGYLLDVLELALSRLRPGGFMLLGDLRSLPLLAAFHTSVVLARAPAAATTDQLRREVARRLEHDTELALDPALFAALAATPRFARIRGLRLRLQRTPHHNELSKFRYTVVLETAAPAAPAAAAAGEPAPAVPLAPELVEAPEMTADRLRAALAACAAPCLALRLANARVWRDVWLARRLAAADAPPTAAGLRAAAEAAARTAAAMDPDEVERIAAAAGFVVEICWSPGDPGCFDAAFWRRDGGRPGEEGVPSTVLLPLTRPAGAGAGRPLGELANAPLRAGGPIDLASELRDHLRARLPGYMVPAHLQVLPALPLGATGKVDRAALPDAETGPPASRQEAAESLQALLEDGIAGLFADLLGLPAVAGGDNFFDLGGHSLLATTLSSRISKAYAVEVPLKLIFEKPTPCAIAEWLCQAMAGAAGMVPPAMVPVGRDRPLPASFAQQRLWFLEQMGVAGTAYGMPILLRLRGRVDSAALKRAFGAILDRHEALRTGFQEVNGEPVQLVFPLAAVPFEETDLSGYPEAEREAVLARLVAAASDARFDLERGPLARTQLFKLGPEEHVLAGAFHHVASDGWSVEVFVREIAELYRAFVSARPPVLAPLPIQYADFAVWQREWLRGEVLERQLAFWKDQLRNLEPLRLVTDHPRPQVNGNRAASHRFAIEAATAEALRKLGRQHGATLFMTLMAGFQALLHRYTGQERIALGVPIANRNRGEIEGLIGFFVNSLVFCIDLGGDPTFLTLLGRVRHAALGAYTHQDLPFERLVEELQPERHLNRNPLFQIAFALQQRKAMRPEFKLPGVEVTMVDLPRIDVRFDMEVHLWEDGEMVRGDAIYDRELFEPATVARLAGHFRSLLAHAAGHPESPLSQLEYMSPEELSQLAAWGDGGKS
jgi:pristinamycin I synthase-3/4